MSVQQNVVAVRVADEAAFTEARRQLELRGDVRVVGSPSEQGPGWVMLLESHACMPEELLTIAQDALGADGAERYALNDDERLRLLAGNDPWAAEARG